LKELYDSAMNDYYHKIVVLDDDSIGTKKVQDIHVYTNWDEESILDGFKSDEQMFFILTNSRAFSEEKTKQVHEDIANRVKKIAEELNQPFKIGRAHV